MKLCGAEILKADKATFRFGENARYASNLIKLLAPLKKIRVKKREKKIAYKKVNEPQKFWRKH